jgi:hypothetical protein
VVSQKDALASSTFGGLLAQAAQAYGLTTITGALRPATAKAKKNPARVSPSRAAS